MKALPALFIFALPLAAAAQTGALETRRESFSASDVQFNQLYAGCVAQTNRDELCRMVIATKQVGDDALETIKELVPMGPFEYTLMTAANVAATGRLRVKIPSPLRDWDGTLDLNREGATQVVFQTTF